MFSVSFRCGISSPRMIDFAGINLQGKKRERETEKMRMASSKMG